MPAVVSAGLSLSWEKRLDYVKSPRRDPLTGTRWLVFSSHQGEPPTVPASVQAGNRDHRWQAERRSDTGHLGQHFEAGRIERKLTAIMRYTIVIEKSPRNYAAYVPDLPGCIATGASEAEAVHSIREAIRLHIESLREHREPVPEPLCTATYVDVAALAG